ncbi:hypothetical protein [Flavobacterium sp.]|uniref:hypothetical protein n=1 Tax=Flavobacterium sp. TaxID=239 RepID=UPI003D6BA3C4
MILQKNINHSHFSRLKNVVYEHCLDDSNHEGKPVLLLIQKFPDYDVLSQAAVDYIEKYAEMFPHLVTDSAKIVPQEKDQLSLF